MTSISAVHRPLRAIAAARCRGYQAIAAVTGVPVGTVRSRLNRARSRLGAALLHTAEGATLSQASLEAERRAQWEHFYTELHKAPVPRTYRDTYAAGVEVRDTARPLERHRRMVGP
jgi:Sigma-70, region 4